MTPEATFLLTSMRQEVTEVPKSLDWGQLLLLAESHGVLPLLVRTRGKQLPEKFRTRSHDRWTRSHFLASELQQLLKTFRSHNVECLALKGPVLAELLYGNVGLRPCDDLDLLVRPEDFSKAESLLLDAGFTPDGPANDYHRGFERRGAYVELHFAAASPSAPPFNFQRAWERSCTVEFRGEPVRFFSAIDLLLYLCLHGLKHRFSRLIWVLDISQAIKALDPEEAERLLDEASAQSLRNVVLAGCLIASRTFSSNLPAAVDAALLTQVELVRKAVDVQNEILATVADPVRSALDATDYLSLADGRGNRWKQRVRAFRPTQQDYEWVGRHHVPPRCAPLVRPFRLLFKYGPMSALDILFPGFRGVPSKNKK